VYALKRAHGIRVVSARIAASLKRRGIDESKVVIQPLQPRLDRFIEVGAQRLYSQDNSKPTTFIFVGRFTKEKNVFLLLKSFSTLAKENSSTKLLLVGDGPLRSSMEKFISESGLNERVNIIEWTEDVAGALGTADVLCLSSDHEGYALVLLEAMAAGMPVITTAVGCAGEVVNDEMQGIVVPVRDINRYTEAMRKLLSASLREQYGRKGYKTATLLIVSERVYLERLCGSLTALAR
jgi:glycosyltransferase involved in cell wall biosynthesis